MKVLFALIFVASHGFGMSGYPKTSSMIRVGAYEKLDQCKAQGKNLVDALAGHEARDAYFFCVPVNQ